MSQPSLQNLLSMPFVFFVTAFAALWLSTWTGVKARSEHTYEREHFNIILGATLTILGLILGFEFSMAISRYNQRKIYEEEEADAIGTEYVRADLLPACDAANVRSLFRRYLDQRISFTRLVTRVSWHKSTRQPRVYRM